jgi:hypothetical protein
MQIFSQSGMPSFLEPSGPVIGLYMVCSTVTCIWTTSRYHESLLRVTKDPYVNTSEQLHVQKYSFTNKLIAVQYPGDCHPSV